MIRMGNGSVSITRICTVLVWLRSIARHRSGRLGSGEVEVVERIACGMIFWDVEGDKVVPLILDLRPFGDGETESPHDLLEMLDGLRDRVDDTDARAKAGQRRIVA
jgi:hypothetical protein